MTTDNYCLDLIRRMERALDNTKLGDYDIYYIYSDLRLLAQPLLLSKQLTKKDLLDQLTDVFLSRGKTIVIPTFTYTTQGVFHLESTHTRLGALNLFVEMHENSIRSSHPLFSYAAVGKNRDISLGLSHNEFGEGSIFTRLRNRNATFLHLGRDVGEGNTLVHHIEEALNVPYRYLKKFPTQSFSGSSFVGENFTAFLRKRDNPKNDYSTNFYPTSEYLHTNKISTEIFSNNQFLNFSRQSFRRI